MAARYSPGFIPNNGGPKKILQTPQACWKYGLQSAHSQLERGLDGQQFSMDQHRGTLPRITTYDHVLQELWI